MKYSGSFCVKNQARNQRPKYSWAPGPRRPVQYQTKKRSEAAQTSIHSARNLRQRRSDVAAELRFTAYLMAVRDRFMTIFSRRGAACSARLPLEPSGGSDRRFRSRAEYRAGAGG